MSALAELFTGQDAQPATKRLDAGLDAIDLRPVVGRVSKVSGTIVEAKLTGARLGEMCALRVSSGDNPDERLAEVVGFREGTALLSVLGEMVGISQSTVVTKTGVPLMAPIGNSLLGRVIDGLGAPLDTATKGPLYPEGRRIAMTPPPDALSRASISEALPLGIPAFDAFNTVGQGQRVGLFGDAGVGKSTLMSAIAKAASADVAVIALVGERGREVSEFIEDSLGPEGMAKSVIVAATSDRPAMERLKAPFVATAIAEGFRDQGLRVVLLMDSLTRLARAQREIGLAAGEPPARRAFPPSVFALLPQLIERAGVSPDGGSITAFYTVLMEDGGVGDPIAEEARSLLDGHIILSRKIAEAGKFPAIDVLASRSRVMSRVAPRSLVDASEHLRALMARYGEIELLLRMGEYQRGSDALADEAILKKDVIDKWIHHDLSNPVTWKETTESLPKFASAKP